MAGASTAAVAEEASAQVLRNYVCDAREKAAAAGWATPPANGNCQPQYGFAYDVTPVASVSTDGTRSLDGDSVPDVIEDRVRWDDSTLVVRSGPDGAQRWSKYRPDLIGYTAMRVGRPARPGVLVAWASQASAVDPALAGLDSYVYLHVAALDGASGRQLWTSTWRAPWNSNLTGHPQLGPTLPGRAGRAGRLLVATGPGGGRLVAVSAADGSSWDVGRYPNMKEIGRLGDVDRDGYSDFYVAGGVKGVDQVPDLEARSSTTGAALWQQHVGLADSSHWELIPLARANDDRLDLYVSTDVWVDESAEVVRCVDALAINGATGARRWSRTDACWLEAVGDADKDGFGDVYDLGREVDRALSGRTGATLWSAQRGCEGYAQFDSRPDLDGDGVGDEVFPDPDCGTSAAYWRSGATGVRHTIANAPAPGLSLGASLDGDGDDYVITSATAFASDSLQVSGQDGLTRTTLWSTTLTYPTPVGSGIAGAADLSGDGRAEVIVTSGRDNTFFVRVLDGATGVLRWSGSL